MYGQVFRENQIDGSILKYDVNSEILIEDLNVKRLHVSKFMREIEKLKNPTGNETNEGGEGEEKEKQQFSGFRLHTFGYGTDHNQSLLEGLAEHFEGMYHFVEHEEMIKAVFASCLGGLLSTVAQDIKLKIPDIREQQKLGVFFSKLDRQIELEEEKLELLEQQKRGYMQKIFTQELKFKNSQLENIKWSYKTLEELNSFFTDGNYGESYPKSEDMSDKNDGVAFLRGSNLKKGRITLEDANYISKKKHSELTTGHLFLDDIVIAVRGSLGAVGYVNENMVGNNINSQLAIIRTSSSLLYGKYLLYYLMSNQGKKELLSRVTGTALKQLPIKQIKQIKVPVPKLYEQHKIANFLSELDNLIDNQTKKKIK